MHEDLRRLPSLDFLRGFEAAGRRLSFTRAAEELFVTQSALSRQIQALEAALGVALFVRRHRALAFTAAGPAFHREITALLNGLAGAAATRAAPRARRGLRCRRRCPSRRCGSFRASRHFALRIRTSTSSSRRTIGWSISHAATSTSRFAIWPTPSRPKARSACSASGCCRSRVRHCCSARRPPLARPADLARHVLLHLDDPDGRMPWLDWRSWLAANGEAGLKPAGSFRFKLYDQVIQAALDGQGVALGRVPLSPGCCAPDGWSRRFLALRVGARLFRGGRAAREGASRRDGVRRVAARRSVARAEARRHAGQGGDRAAAEARPMSEGCATPSHATSRPRRG